MAWAYALVFAVSTVANMVERPDGLKIAGCFIAAIVIKVIANGPNERDERNIRPNGRRSGRSTGSPKTSPRCSSRCRVADASEFEADLEIRSEERFGYQVLTVSSAAVPNSIAAICLAMRDEFGLIPHGYFDWTEGSPLIHFLRFILWARARSPRSPVRSCAGPNPASPPPARARGLRTGRTGHPRITAVSFPRAAPRSPGAAHAAALAYIAPRG
jgi:hypothetical protein